MDLGGAEMAFHGIITGVGQEGFGLVTQSAGVTGATDGDELGFPGKTQDGDQNFFGQGRQTPWRSGVFATEDGANNMAPIEIGITLLAILAYLGDLFNFSGLEGGKLRAWLGLGTAVTPPGLDSTRPAPATALGS